MTSAAATLHRSNLAQAARQSLRALCPPALKRWRERRHFLKMGEVELHLVPLLCRRDRDAIDVGANEGAYLHVMIGRARRVLAFEPVPWLAASLAEKFDESVAVHELALSRELGIAVLRMPVVEGAAVTGLASLAGSPFPAAARQCELRVRTSPLDTIYGGDAGFMKIDVEGHEEAVLDGAARTIGRCRPRILVEMEERFSPGAVARGSARFARWGYRGFYVHRRQLRPLATFDPGALQRAEDIAAFTGSAPRAACADYVNNFLFLADEDCADLVPRLGVALARHAPGG